MDMRRVRSISECEEVRSGYALPFQKADIAPVISQGYDGPYSHFAVEKFKAIISDDTFSLDFVLGLGTEVLAAKNGVVEGKLNGFKEYYQGTDFREGLLYTPNFVLLRHSDKTSTLYAHLETGSIVVKNRQRVAQGQPIAKTGLSGWVGPTPHLHFSGFRYQGDNRLTFPILFNDYQGPLFHNQLPKSA